MNNETIMLKMPTDPTHMELTLRPMDRNTYVAECQINGEQVFVLACTTSGMIVVKVYIGNCGPANPPLAKGHGKDLASALNMAIASRLADHARKDAILRKLKAE